MVVHAPNQLLAKAALVSTVNVLIASALNEAILLALKGLFILSESLIVMQFLNVCFICI